jgi:hypothetical protein
MPGSVRIAPTGWAFVLAGDKAGQQQADSRCQQNAMQIADFLSKANPDWPKDTLADLMKKHLSTTTRPDTAPTTNLFLLEVVALALGSVARWLGGELVDRLGVGVDDGAHLDAPSSLSGRPARQR